MLVGQFCGITSNIHSVFLFLKLDGIVPGIVFSTIGNCVVTYHFARTVKIEKIVMSIKDTIDISKALVSLGFALVIASLIGNLTNYLINISITHFGGLSDLGLYGAGMSITMQAMSFVFSSMASDYFPRLSASMGDKELMNQTINEQSEIILYLAVPILSVFMIISPLLIRILLSADFLPVAGFIRIICVGMLMRAASYALGYASFARGDKKVYLFLEGGYSNFSNLVLSVGMYYLWGLNGLALSFVVNYSLYYILIRFVDAKRYGYQASNDVNMLIFLSVLLMFLLLAISYLLPKVWYYSIGCVITLVLCLFYLKALNAKTGILKTILYRIQNQRDSRKGNYIFDEN